MKNYSDSWWTLWVLRHSKIVFLKISLTLSLLSFQILLFSQFLMKKWKGPISTSSPARSLLRLCLQAGWHLDLLGREPWRLVDSLYPPRVGNNIWSKAVAAGIFETLTQTGKKKEMNSDYFLSRNSMNESKFCSFISIQKSLFLSMFLYCSYKAFNWPCIIEFIDLYHCA